MPSVSDVIVHCQKQIKKEPPAEKLIHYLNRLDRLRVTVQDLMDTGVGRTVNQLSRHDGYVGKFASTLVNKWKAMVSDEPDTEDSESSSQEDEPATRKDDEEENGEHDVGDNGVQSIIKQESVNYDRDVNGHREYSSHEDSDDDRLCIADESGNQSSSVVKQEPILPSSSGEETEGCDEEMYHQQGKVPVEENRLNHKIKAERLSESDDDNSSGEEQDNYQTQLLVPQKNHIKLENEAFKIKLEDEPGSSHQHKQQHKTTSSSSTLENKSSRHHRSDKYKSKKDNHHSKEKKHKKEKEKSRSPSKVKIEPKSDESENNNEDYSSSKHKEKKSKRSSREKNDDEQRPRSSSRDHNTNKDDKKDEYSSSDSHHHKTNKRKHKDRDRGESLQVQNNGESLSNKKRSEANSSSSSCSPDRKKIKLEEYKTTTIKEHSLTKKPSIHIDEEINSASGVKFEELLGCLDKTLNKTKDKHNKEKEKLKKHSSSGKVKEEVTKLVRRNDSKKNPTATIDDKKSRKYNLESIIAPTSVNISPNYKPPIALAMLQRPMFVPSPSKLASGNNLNILETCDPGNYWEDSRMVNNNCSNNNFNQDDALSSMMSSRNQRTKVFSGRTIACKSVVPRLYDMCMQVIQENIGDLGYTGGVPFEILKPALERATAQQLLLIEEYNPYLIGSTDELWRFHSNREFRGRDRLEMETWRELYERCMLERDEKFAIVRKKMLKKVEVAEPVRKAKLAYVEPVGGPRFNKQKAATIKNGMKSLKIKEEKGPKKGVGSSASVGFNNPTDTSKIVHEQAVIINPESRAGHAPSTSRGGGGGRREEGESSARIKPKKAPLMMKTMKFIKTLQRR